VTPEQRISYSRAVWAAFQYKAKTHRDMSSAEFYNVGRWMDRGVPLPLVLRAIHEFDGVPRRLEAVASKVDAAYEYWRQAIGGVP